MVSLRQSGHAGRAPSLSDARISEMTFATILITWWQRRCVCVGCFAVCVGVCMYAICVTGGPPLTPSCYVCGSAAVARFTRHASSENEILHTDMHETRATTKFAIPLQHAASKCCCGSSLGHIFESPFGTFLVLSTSVKRKHI